MATAKFRAECGEKRIIFNFSLTEIEAEKVYGSAEHIEAKVRLAYRKEISLENTESHLYGRIS
jgi:hypothetical protein